MCGRRADRLRRHGPAHACTTGLAGRTRSTMPIHLVVCSRPSSGRPDASFRRTPPFHASPPCHDPGDPGRGGDVHVGRPGLVADAPAAGRRPRRPHGPGPVGVATRRRQLLVGDELALQHHAGRPVDGLDLEGHGDARPVRERHEPRRPHPDRPARRGAPDRRPAQDAVAQVERPLVLEQRAVAHVERLVVDEQPDDLAVRHVDDGLPRLRVAVARLGVRQRPRLVEAVEVRARDTVGLALLQVGPQPDVPVGQGEYRLALREHSEV